MNDHPSDDDVSPAPGSADQFTLKDKLRALEGIIGHQKQHTYFTQGRQARYLGLDSAQWSRKVNGEHRVRESELAKLIQYFGLGPRLDYRLFLQPTLEGFLSQLEIAGIGTYGGSNRSRLCNLLHKAAKASSNRIRIVASQSRAARGGIGRPGASRPEIPVFRNRDQVRIACEGPVGQFLVLLNADYNGTVTILTPTEMAPLQAVKEPLVMVPDPLSDAFVVQDDINDFYLYGLWTDAAIAGLFQGSSADSQDDLTEEAARVVLMRLEAQATPIEAAAFNFTVGR